MDDAIHFVAQSQKTPSTNSGDASVRHDDEACGVGLQCRRQEHVRPAPVFLSRGVYSCPVARQGVLFCLAGLMVVCETLRNPHAMADVILLPHHLFDQCLESSLPEDLVVQDLTGMEEVVFVDWAGEERRSECGLYLVLYFFRQPRLESARKLYLPSAETVRQSTNRASLQRRLSPRCGCLFCRTCGDISAKDSRALPFPPQVRQLTVMRAAEEAVESDASADEEMESDAEVAALLGACRSTMPFHFHSRQLPKEFDRSTPFSISSYSELMSSENFCPLQTGGGGGPASHKDALAGAAS